MLQSRRIATIQTLIGLIFLIISPTFAAIENLKISAPSLVFSNRTIIATPKSFDRNRPERYPVILMLHGWSGDETQWYQDAPLQKMADTYNILLVLPDGGYDGWWSDSKLRPSRNYETHIVKELLPYLEENYNATQSKNQRGLTGFSMGGYGSVALLLRNPDVFCAAASLSGIMDIIAHGTQWGLLQTFGDQSTGLPEWQANNPLDLINRLPGRKLPPIFLICGSEDFAYQENVAMAERLNKKGADFLFLFPPGTHSHPFWQENIGEAVKFLVLNFKSDKRALR
ncbi:MAG TPA: hypothetical protein DHU63_03450 [Candidatus Marinimicrobia bacterium]|nr:MAG: hypothetical protein AUJ47_03110 [Candidatus Marinimicrobia bacterium CG1_02_48_14]HCW75574.1 hypothetical protein [Candidatus Neomarinimicrobiota bacterium]